MTPVVVQTNEKPEGLYVPASRFAFARSLLRQPRTIDNAMEFGGVKAVYVDKDLKDHDAWYYVVHIAETLAK